MKKHYRRSVRLKECDYSKPGYYFVTLCTKNRENIFGKIVGVQNFEPLHKNEPIYSKESLDRKKYHRFQHVVPKSLGAIIRGFKIRVTNWSRQNFCKHQVWQRNYYEHIIRDEMELCHFREYILKNPAMWKRDENNQDNIF